jgi:hypothetical protein
MLFLTFQIYDRDGILQDKQIASREIVFAFYPLFSSSRGCQMVHIFSYQKSQFGYFLEGREMKRWYLLSFGILSLFGKWYT